MGVMSHKFCKFCIRGYIGGGWTYISTAFLMFRPKQTGLQFLKGCFERKSDKEENGCGGDGCAFYFPFLQACYTTLLELFRRRVANVPPSTYLLARHHFRQHYCPVVSTLALKYFQWIVTVTWIPAMTPSCFSSVFSFQLVFMLLTETIAGNCRQWSPCEGDI